MVKQHRRPVAALLLEAIVQTGNLNDKLKAVKAFIQLDFCATL